MHPCSLALAALLLTADASPPTVGAKAFSESVLMREAVAQLAEHRGIAVRQTPALQGSQLAWEALLRGDIDVYLDYTGTLAHEILQDSSLDSAEEIRAALAAKGIEMSASLGYGNPYGIGMKRTTARRLGIESISDLRDHPELRLGFGNEFLERADCWPTLRVRYALPQKWIRGLDHSLAYQGIDSGDIDAMDVYLTDAGIEQFDLVVLEDDLKHFPDYDAVFVFRRELNRQCPELVSILKSFEHRIDEPTMRRMNIRADVDKEPEAVVAHDLLAQLFGVDTSYAVESLWGRMRRYTLEHLFLVVCSLVPAICVAIPLGIVAARFPTLGQFILSGAEIVQTIPGLALLVLLMPVVRLVGVSGISAAPVILALFLYSLLPIIRNTYAGMNGIPHTLRESATALGLTSGARLWRIELPLASRMILAGIKTTAVINVGFATLGGLIGAGGYGELIMQGLRKSSESRMLEGAVPAAILALVIKFAFELAERRLVPRGLRVSSE